MLGRLGLAVLLGVIAGCSHRDGNGTRTCEDQEPTFSVTVRAAEGSLPPSTQLLVRYGGDQTEEYRPGDAAAGRMVFCQTSDAGVVSVRCELYTGQAAELTIQAPGLTPFDQVLTPERSDLDCIVTTPVDVVLEAADAGG